MRRLFSLRMKDEGQATTEYILVLAIMVGILVMAMNNFIKPLFLRVTQTITNTIEKQLFGGDLHTFKIGR